MSQTPWSPPEGDNQGLGPESKPDLELAPQSDADLEDDDRRVIEITGLSFEQVAEPPQTDEPSEVEAEEPTTIDEEDSLASGLEDEAPLSSEEIVMNRDDLDSDWVTVGQAARILEVSESTVRRRLASGSLRGELVHDPLIGARRWMIHIDELPTSDSSAGTLVPIEAIDRLESAWEALREATARAELAERIDEFEKGRRIEAEQERDRLRSLLSAEHQLAERVSGLERDKRVQVEKERDRLLAILNAEPQPKSRWRTWLERIGS